MRLASRAALLALLPLPAAARQEAPPAAPPAPPRPALARPAPPAAPKGRLVVLASTGAQFAEFSDPAAARSGFVVFHALLKDGRTSIWTAAGGAPALVAQGGGELRDAGATYHFEQLGRQPTVNDRGEVAFTATLAEGGRGVFQAQAPGGAIGFVADSGEAFREFGEMAAINASRQVAFFATIDPPNHPDRSDTSPARARDPATRARPDALPPPLRSTFDGEARSFESGLFLDRGADLVRVASTRGGVLDVQDGFALNDAGVVAFRASRRAKHWSLLLDAGASPVTLAESDALVAAFEQPAINDHGAVAFVERFADGTGAVCRSRIGSTVPEVVADAAAGYRAFGPNVAIDDAGRVAFVALRDDGVEVLALAPAVGAPGAALPGRGIDELLAVGATIDGKPIADLRLGSRSFARADRIVLLARQDGGGEAIVALHLAAR